MINNKLSLYGVGQTDWEMHSQYIVKGNLQRSIIASTPISLRWQLVPLNVIKSGTRMHRGTEVGGCNVIFMWSQSSEVLIYAVNNAQMLTTERLILFSNTNAHTHTKCEHSWAEMSTYQMSPVISTHLYLPRGSAPAEPVCMLMLTGCSTYRGHHAFCPSAVDYVAVYSLYILPFTILIKKINNSALATLSTILYINMPADTGMRSLYVSVYYVGWESDVIYRMNPANSQTSSIGLAVRWHDWVVMPLKWMLSPWEWLSDSHQGLEWPVSLLLFMRPLMERKRHKLNWTNQCLFLLTP